MNPTDPATLPESLRTASRVVGIEDSAVERAAIVIELNRIANTLAYFVERAELKELFG